MVLWLGFAPVAVGFGSVKNLYHKAVVYNSVWQGCQTPGGVAIHEVLQHLHTTANKYNNNNIRHHISNATKYKRNVMGFHKTT